MNQGVSIPEELSGIDLPKLFADLESNPDMVVSLGWTTLADFIEEVRFVVKSHYGISTAPSARVLAYTLQYSTLYSWNATTMPNYNATPMPSDGHPIVNREIFQSIVQSFFQH